VSAQREFKGYQAICVSVLSVMFIAFHLAYIGQVFLRFEIVILPSQMREISLGFGLVLAFLIFPATRTTRPGLPWYDIVLILMSVASTIYLLSLSQIVLHGRAYATNLDCLFAFFLFIPLIEAMRRTGSTIVVIIGVLFIIYAYFANHFTGFLWGPGWGTRRLVAFLYTSMDGFFGMAMGVFALILVPFLTLAALLRATGVGNFFMETSLAVAGWARGGPAKVAVIASALFGTLSGSSIANVATTGMVTIPLMKKVGYKPEIAGAVEASASTGGQIMPPIMGAAAFLMAEFLGVPYWTIVKAAFVPALFYFLFLLLSVDAEAVKSKLMGIPRKQLPSFKKVIVRGWYYLIPIVGLIIALGVFFWRAEMCAILAMGLCVVVSFARRDTMLGPKKMLHAIEDGARSTLSLGALSGGLGMIIGIMGLTGLGLNLSGALIDLSGGNLLILLILTAFAAMVLGMGMPTAGVYLFCALILGPALIQLGVIPIAAHMFIFYFGLAGLLTPPVAMAAYTAAPIAGAPFFLTGWQAMRLSIPLYVIPFVFIYRSGLLLVGEPLAVIISILLTLGITIAFVHGITGWSFFTHLGWKRRFIFLVSGLLIAIPKSGFTLVGVALFVIMFLSEVGVAWRKRRSELW
jgi:TRAP transporter 4TM/12TM fusion protein